MGYQAHSADDFAEAELASTQVRSRHYGHGRSQGGSGRHAVRSSSIKERTFGERWRLDGYTARTAGPSVEYSSRIGTRRAARRWSLIRKVASLAIPYPARVASRTASAFVALKRPLTATMRTCPSMLKRLRATGRKTPEAQDAAARGASANGSASTSPPRRGRRGYGRSVQEIRPLPGERDAPRRSLQQADAQPVFEAQYAFAHRRPRQTDAFRRRGEALGLGDVNKGVDVPHSFDGHGLTRHWRF